MRQKMNHSRVQYCCARYCIAQFFSAYRSLAKRRIVTERRTANGWVRAMVQSIEQPEQRRPAGVMASVRCAVFVQENRLTIGR